jgi:hypothetical protein
MNKVTALGALALAFSASQVSATTTVFTDQASFNSAAGTAVLEDFEDGSLATGLSITSSTGTVAGGNFADRLVPGQSTVFNFATGQSAFGGIFDLSPGGAGLGLLLTLGLANGSTETVTQEIASSCTGCFFGFTSTNPFLSVTFTSGTQGGSAETYNVNSLSFASANVGAVPEPSTWAMMLLGFFGVAGAMRTRRTVSFAF